MNNLNKNTFGWNNSIYAGEYDSNFDYSFSYIFDPIDSVDSFELSFNMLLIEPKNASIEFDPVDNIFSKIHCGICYELDNSKINIEVKKLGISIRNKKEVRIMAHEYNIKIKSYSEMITCGCYISFINMANWSKKFAFNNLIIKKIG